MNRFGRDLFPRANINCIGEDLEREGERERERFIGQIRRITLLSARLDLEYSFFLFFFCQDKLNRINRFRRTVINGEIIERQKWGFDPYFSTFRIIYWW